jgi:uncharacterized MAPEG superfamily protein
MNSAMVLSVDMRLLAYSALLSIIMWLPYIFLAIKTFGLKNLLGYPTPDYSGLAQWAQRLYRAHSNLLENLTPFAILVIISHLTGAANEMTAMGARLFFWSRLAQIIFHMTGIPFGRTLTFAIGWVGNIIIFLQIIG